MMMMNDD